jgi:hypothetical protein
MSYGESRWQAARLAVRLTLLLVAQPLARVAEIINELWK